MLVQFDKKEKLGILRILYDMEEWQKESLQNIRLIEGWEEIFGEDPKVLLIDVIMAPAFMANFVGKNFPIMVFSLWQNRG